MISEEIANCELKATCQAVRTDDFNDVATHSQLAIHNFFVTCQAVRTDDFNDVATHSQLAIHNFFVWIRCSSTAMRLLCDGSVVRSAVSFTV
jgi:hypothetical protein